MSATPRPTGWENLLSRGSWDHDGVRDDLREYVIEGLGDPAAILVVDKTGDVKKGRATVGVSRQYTGTAGKVENGTLNRSNSGQIDTLRERRQALITAAVTGQ